MNNPRFALHATTGWVLLALACLSASAGAEEWKVTPRILVSETYTDNVTLTPSSLAKSDWVTQVVPGIAVEGKGNRLRVNLDYSLQNLAYADTSQRNKSYQQLNARANATLIENALFLDAKGNIQQQAASLLDPISTNNTNPNNIAEISTYSVSPYLVHKFGSTAVGTARFSHEVMETAIASLSDNASDRIQLNLDNGAAFNDLGWGLAYSDEKVDYKLRPDTETKIFSGTATYRVLPKVRVSATAGYEKSKNLYTVDAPKGSFWNAGFSWTPSTVTSMSATMGERYFGKTYTLDLSHSTAMTVWKASYMQDITSLRSEVFNLDYIGAINWAEYVAGAIYDVFGYSATNKEILDEASRYARSKGIPLFVLSNQLFTSKQFIGSVAVKSGKSLATLTATHSVREAQETSAYTSILIGSPLATPNEDTVKQYGLNGRWDIRVSRRDMVNLGIGARRARFEQNERTDDYRYLSLGMTRALEKKVSGSVEFRHGSRNSTADNSDYTENAISAKLLWTFN